jgi:hypothetical protein
MGVGKMGIEKFFNKLVEIGLENLKTLVTCFFSRNGFQKETQEML